MIPDYILQLIWAWNFAWIIIFICYVGATATHDRILDKRWKQFIRESSNRMGGTRQAPYKKRPQTTLGVES